MRQAAVVVVSLIGCGTSEPPIVYTGEPQRFVVSSIELPTNNSQAREYGLDLNGNNVIDNQLGMVFSLLMSFGDLTTHGQDMIDSGIIASSVEIVADDPANDETVAIRYFGAEGDEPTLISGAFVDGAFATTEAPGDAKLHLPVFADADPSVVRIRHARIVLVPDGSGGYLASVAGGVDPGEANMVALASAAQMIEAHPNDHVAFMNIIDKNGDRILAQSEWNTNALLQAVMADDVELGDRPLISIGIRAHLTPCASGRCSSEPPANTCFDRLLGGDETDIDCGGSCPKCSAGRTCAAAADCEANGCDGGACRAPSCTDGIRDGFETDLDCGGDCDGCANGDACYRDGDCASGQCGEPCSGSFCFENWDTCRP